MEEEYSILKVLAIFFGIALVICAISIPLLIYHVNNPESNYDKCLEKCPSDHKFNFADLECPKMCAEIHLNCLNYGEIPKGVKD